MSCGNVWWEYRSVLIPLGICGVLLISWIAIDVVSTSWGYRGHDREIGPIRWPVVLLVSTIVIVVVAMALDAADVRGPTLAGVALHWIRHRLGI